MPNLRVINHRSGNADFKIAAATYKSTVTSMEFETNVNQDDETTFGDEPDPVFGEGATIHRFTIAGLMKEGDTMAAPFLPLPQNTGSNTITMNFGGNGTNGNKLSFNGNGTRNLLRRDTMQKGVFGFTGVATGPIAVTWNTST